MLDRIRREGESKMIAKMSVRTKIILSYILLGIVLILVFSTIVSTTIYKKGIEDINYEVDKALIQSYEAASLLLIPLYDYMYNIYYNDYDIVNALYSTEFDRFEMYTIHRRLKNLSNFSPVIDSIYIYNANANIVFSSISASREENEFYEENISNVILKYCMSDKSILLPRVTEYRFLSTTFLSTQLISIIYTTPKNGLPTEAMIINLAKEKLQTIICQSLQDSDKMQLLIMDNYGTPIVHSSSKLFDNILPQPYMDTIYKSVKERGRFLGNINGHPCIISFIRAPKLGCVFVNVASYKDLLNNVNNIQKVIFSITLIFVGIGILGALYFTRILYAPLKTLVQNIKRSEYACLNECYDEYEYVTSFMNNMKDKINELYDMVSSCFPAKKNNILKDIIYGNVSNLADYELWLSKYNIHLKGPYYVVILLRLDDFAKLKEREGIKTIISYRLELSKMVFDNISKLCSLEIIEDKLEWIPIILNLEDDSQEWFANIQNMLHIIQENFYNKHNATITIGISKIGYSITDIKDLFIQAVESSNYRIIFGRSSIIRYDDVFLRKEYQYPLSIEKAIIDNLKLGNKKHIQHLLDEFIKHIRDCHYNEILLSFTQLILIIMRTRQNMGILSNEVMRLDYMDIQHKLNNYVSLNEIKEWIISIIYKVIDEKECHIQDKNVKIVEIVQRFIKENYQDSSLTIEKLAEMAGLSPNYLRNIFKSVTGISISNYIMEVRFDKAKELLLKTNYTAKKIAMMTGFQNENYFYHSFKKYTGKTPMEFRRNLKHNLNDSVQSSV